MWRFLSCLQLGDYSQYFNVTTKEVTTRLKYTIYGHYTGMQRPSFTNSHSNYQGVGQLAEPQEEKPDFDLYAPFWIMITLVVECSIIGLLNMYINAYVADNYTADKMLDVSYSIGNILNLFFYMLIFFVTPPLAIYFFARVKLLDGSTKFWRLFAALGYSYVSYIPAIMLTLVGVGLVKWIVIGLACANQLFGLYKQADQLVPHQATQQESKALSSTNSSS